MLELVEGETLSERIQRGPIPLQEALRISADISEALAAAHEKRIVHRDLKPANVFRGSTTLPRWQVARLDPGRAVANGNGRSRSDQGSPQLVHRASATSSVKVVSV